MTLAKLSAFTLHQFLAPHGIENENVTPGSSFGVAHRRPRWFSIKRVTESPIPTVNFSCVKGPE